MTQRLHLVFGGELVDPTKNVFKDVDDIHIVGIFPNYAAAYDAWKSEAQRTVDNAHMRYYIAHLHRLRDELTKRLEREGRMDIAQACFDFLPTRARLDIAGWEDKDIFSHE